MGYRPYALVWRRSVLVWEVPRLPSIIAAHDGGEACVCDLTEPPALALIRALQGAGLPQNVARDTESVGCVRDTDLTPMRREVIEVGKPSKAALSKAGSTLASSGSSKSSKSKAGSTLGKG